MSRSLWSWLLLGLSRLWQTAAGSSKKGVGLHPSTRWGQRQLDALGVSWYYNWGSSATAGVTTPFVPMVFSGDSLQTIKVPTLGPYVLGFQEPDNPFQSNLTVPETWKLWQKVVALSTGQVGSPGLYNDPTAIWMPQFMLVNPKVDFIAVHWYKGTDFGQFQKDINAVVEAYNLPVWITEFAPQSLAAAVANPTLYNQSVVTSFLVEAVAWMEQSPMIQRYSWTDSKVGTSSLFLPNGNLSATGLAYAQADGSLVLETSPAGLGWPQPPQPPVGSVVIIESTVLLSTVQANSAQSQAALLSLRVPDAFDTPPDQDLALLVDTSLSAAGSGKLELVKEMLVAIIQNLRPQDRLHLITCSGAARVEFVAGTLQQQALLTSIVAGLTPTASSFSRPRDGSAPVPVARAELQACMSLAESVLEANDRMTASRRAMVFTDGILDGASALQRRRVLDAADHLQRLGVVLSVVAMGEDFDQVLLPWMAEAGHGDLLLGTGHDSVTAVVNASSPSSLRPVALEADLLLLPLVGASALAVYGERAQPGDPRPETTSLWGDWSTRAVQLGTIRTGKPQLLLLEFYLPPQVSDPQFLTFELHYLPSVDRAGPRISQRGSVAASVTAGSEPQAPPNAGVRLLQRFYHLRTLADDLEVEEEEMEARVLPSGLQRGTGDYVSELTGRRLSLDSDLQNYVLEVENAVLLDPGLTSLGLLERAQQALALSRRTARPWSKKAAMSTVWPRSSFAMSIGSPPLQSTPL